VTVLWPGPIHQHWLARTFHQWELEDFPSGSFAPGSKGERTQRNGIATENTLANQLLQLHHRDCIIPYAMISAVASASRQKRQCPATPRKPRPATKHQRTLSPSTGPPRAPSFLSMVTG